MNTLSIGSAKSAWEVFILFLIPIGGGIPAGSLLAHSRGMGWLAMTILYFLSDIVLAFSFEPIMRLFLLASKKIPFLLRFREAFKKSTNQTLARYGPKPGPLTLITIAFGVDPMTGRAAALAAGHGFVSGWAVAITGDMFFYALIAYSTIKLNKVLGDGTLTAVIIMLAMLVVPGIIRRIRSRK